MFIDSARVTVRAGCGGNGCVSFRREKHVPHGGPNGGDGGHGGSVIVRANQSFNTLLHIHHQRLIRATRGVHGQGSNKTGANGEDAYIAVPPGTVVRNASDSTLLGDLVEDGQELVVARGGRGGRGNARFATATNQAPRRADEGKKGEEFELEFELKLIADLGLIGQPNAGKSTLLSRISAARPRIADYPFTTLEPHLGVMQAPGDDFRTLVVADIPGLIEGAHAGAGLGIQFLRHVERCAGLVQLVDLVEDGALAERINAIREELASYSPALSSRSWMLVGTKLDAVSDREDRLAELGEAARDHRVQWCAISAVSGEGLQALVSALFVLVEGGDP